MQLKSNYISTQFRRQTIQLNCNVKTFKSTALTISHSITYQIHQTAFVQRVRKKGGKAYFALFAP